MPTHPMNAAWVERMVEIPPSGRVDYFDEKVKGLGLRVSSTGKKIWIVLFRVRGETEKHRVTLGSYPSISLADARDKARAMMVEAAAGLDPSAPKKAMKKSPTFEELANEYLERHAKVKKRSWQEDERILKKDVFPSIGKRKALDIRRREIIELLDEIAGRGAPIAANRTLAVIRKAYNWGIQRDLIDVNPCVQIVAPGQEQERDRVLTEDEIRKVWAAIEALDPHVTNPRYKSDPVMASMFKLRFLTAQRGGEVETMRWADVDLANGWWTIPAEFAKNKLSHRVPLTRAALDLLAVLKDITGDQEWVFPSRTAKGKPIMNIQKAAQRVQDSSKVDFVMHDLRRTAASYMASLGVPRMVISKVLNHVEPGITRVYDRHSYDAEKRDAIERWAAKLAAVLSVQPKS